jgi:hypothetical protein
MSFPGGRRRRSGPGSRGWRDQRGWRDAQDEQVADGALAGLAGLALADAGSVTRGDIGNPVVTMVPRVRSYVGSYSMELPGG